MKRKIKIIGLTVLVVAAVAIWLVLRQAELQIERGVLSYLESRGVKSGKIHVSSVSVSSLDLDSFSLGETLSLEKAAVTFSPGELFHGRLQQVVIDRLALSINGDAAPALGDISKLITPSTPSETMAPMPFASLEIKSLEISYHKAGEIQKILLDGVTLNQSKNLEVKAANIHHEAPKPFFVPLAASIVVSPEGLIAGEINVIGRPVQIALAGEWKNGKGELKTVLKPVTFDSGVLQPDEILPAMAGMLLQTKGTLSAQMQFSNFDSDKLTSIGVFTLKDMSVTMKGMRAEGLSGAVQMKSLLPPLTAGKQTINIKKLQAGIPLEGERLQFELVSGPALVLHPTKWDWSGGSLITDRLQMKFADMGRQQFKLHVRHIDLKSLLSLVVEQGLEAEGKLDGTIPVRLENGQVFIDNASLQAIAPGVVQYKPASPEALGSGAQSQLLMDALKNFHYQLLALAINSPAPDLAEVKLSLKGSNPELYDGKAIELNVNLQGNLADIIKQGAAAYALPGEIEKQIMKQHAP